MNDGHDLFIGGQWRPAASDRQFDVVCPSTEETIGRVPLGSPADIDDAVDAARSAFDNGTWREMPIGERVAALRRLSETLARRANELVPLIVAEIGVPIRTGPARVDRAVLLLETYAEIAEQFVFAERRAGVFGPVEVIREPVGVVGAIVPWNGPLFTPLMKLAPALLAGCAAVVKPSPEIGLDSMVLAECFAEAELPEGVVSFIPGDGDLGAYLVDHPGVDKISFTGSTAVGRQIAASCGRSLKRVSAELGGKSAAIVLDDADLDVVVEAVEASALGTNGQQCFGLTRVLATPGVYEETVERLGGRMRELRVGDPFDAETEIGPLVSAVQRDRVERYIASGRTEGATCIVGASRDALPSKGWYVAPTLFANVDNRMRIAQEEIFGPVICVVPVGDDCEAVAVANDSPYGLSGAVFTHDVDRGFGIARSVRTGTFTINGFRVDWKAPFGGMKSSGLGREHGSEVFQSYTETKSIALPRDVAGVATGRVA